MAIKASIICIVFLLQCCLISSQDTDSCDPVCSPVPYDCSDTNKLNAAQFTITTDGATAQEKFYFGGASSAYQVEGAAGRAPNIWDGFTHTYADMPDMSKDNGDRATDSYHLYEKDVKSLEELGANAYRFSIAWSRITWPRVIQNGNQSEKLLYNIINWKGVAYYNNLINELKSKGIKPFVTLFHWDLPQYLENEYGGFLNRRIVDDFVKYADFCFENFGDRVKNWITLNQPFSYAYKGYGDGILQIGVLLGGLKETVLVGTPDTQKGQVGASLITRWFEPYDSSSNNDKQATSRAFDFFLGWFLEPMTKGDYPETMRYLIGDRLPWFTLEETRVVKNSLDFLGVNYYLAQYVQDNLNSRPLIPTVMTDAGIIYKDSDKDGRPIGPEKFGGGFAHPPGLKKILIHIKDKYGELPMYITENGYRTDGGGLREEIINDQNRINYHCGHLACLKCAIETQQLDVRGYFVWSNLDNYEFIDGFSVRFGMNYVDFKDPNEREAKESAKWFKKFNKDAGNSPPLPDNSPPPPSNRPPPPANSPPPSPNSPPPPLSNRPPPPGSISKKSKLLRASI